MAYKEEESTSCYLLGKHAPNLVRHARLKSKDWQRLDTKMVERMREPSAPTTLVDLALKAECAVEHSSRTRDELVDAKFLRFVDEQVKELFDALPSEVHTRAQRQLRDLVINFSASDSKYLDRVGEMAATVYLASTSIGGTLKAIETPIPGRESSLDVQVELKGSEIPVEFLNVHVQDDRLSCVKDLHKFLDGRVAQKVRAKTGKDLEKRGPLPFPLLLILWFERVETLQRFASALQRRSARRGGTELPICVLQQFGDGDGIVEWRFGSVASLFPKRPGCLTRFVS